MTGSYSVLLPDGRTQIVTYKADKHGYMLTSHMKGKPDTPNTSLVPTPLTPPPLTPRLPTLNHRTQLILNHPTLKTSYPEPVYLKSSFSHPAYPYVAYPEPVYPKAAYSEPTYPRLAFAKPMYSAYSKLSYPMPSYPA